MNAVRGPPSPAPPKKNHALLESICGISELPQAPYWEGNYRVNWNALGSYPRAFYDLVGEAGTKDTNANKAGIAEGEK